MSENPQALIVFWDGKPHLAQDLDNVLPGLAEHARNNEVLVEEWPALQVRYANLLFAVIVAVGIACLVPALVVWGVSVLVYGSSAVDGLEPVIPPLVFGAVTLLLACLAWPLAVIHYCVFRPTITLRGGILHVSTGSDPPTVFSAPISQCCWFRGWVNDTVLTRHSPGGPWRHHAIVVQFPQQSRFTVNSRVAVGLTPQMHALWEAFLTITEVPQISRQDRGGLQGFYGRPGHIEMGVAPSKDARSDLDSGRVAPGDCSPGAPTDPDVQVSRIRFLK